MYVMAHPCVLEDIGPLGPLPKKEEKEEKRKKERRKERKKKGNKPDRATMRPVSLRGAKYALIVFDGWMNRIGR